MLLSSSRSPFPIRDLEFGIRIWVCGAQCACDDEWNRMQFKQKTEKEKRHQSQVPSSSYAHHIDRRQFCRSSRFQDSIWFRVIFSSAVPTTAVDETKTMKSKFTRRNEKKQNKKKNDDDEEHCEWILFIHFCLPMKEFKIVFVWLCVRTIAPFGKWSVRCRRWWRRQMWRWRWRQWQWNERVTFCIVCRVQQTYSISLSPMLSRSLTKHANCNPKPKSVRAGNGIVFASVVSCILRCKRINTYYSDWCQHGVRSSRFNIITHYALRICFRLSFLCVLFFLFPNFSRALRFFHFMRFDRMPFQGATTTAAQIIAIVCRCRCQFLSLSLSFRLLLIAYRCEDLGLSLQCQKRRRRRWQGMAEHMTYIRRLYIINTQNACNIQQIGSIHETERTNGILGTHFCNFAICKNEQTCPTRTRSAFELNSTYSHFVQLSHTHTCTH